MKPNGRSSSSPSPYVISLGNLRSGAPPTRAQLALAEFLFGVAPERPLALIKPMDVAVIGDQVLVSDGALQAVLSWSAARPSLEQVALAGSTVGPRVLAVTPTGDRLVAGGTGGVQRYAANGNLVARFDVEPASLRVGGAAVLDDELWITNTAAHRIDVFDASSGRHIRAIGGRGLGPGEFGFPMGVAAAPDGSALVADMLNARVQVLSRDGTWIRDIGGPGDGPGNLARPKAVAAGPDGTIFVSDAAAQCVKAYSPEGRALLAFGGSDAGTDALALPAGVAVFAGPVLAAREAQPPFQVAYYVLVAEQIARPGLRAFAWSGSREPPELPAPRARAVLSAAVENPHWNTSRCTTCHNVVGDQIDPIPASKVDGLCLSCHDGKKASEEPHPIGRPAASRVTQAPSGWPLNDGRIGCLTCHDFQQHCSTSTARPRENATFVRNFDSQTPLVFCTQCHIAENWRINPHRPAEGSAGPLSSCVFCHQATPAIPTDGLRQNDPKLRAATSQLCLNCHTMHADPAPHGHLEQVVTDSMKHRIVAGQADLLPLSDERVTCYTCHNPHSPVLFGPESILGARARSSASAAVDLRMDHIELCLYCHPK